MEFIINFDSDSSRPWGGRARAPNSDWNKWTTDPLQIEMRLCHVGSVRQRLAVGVFRFGLPLLPRQNGRQIPVR